MAQNEPVLIKRGQILPEFARSLLISTKSVWMTVWIILSIWMSEKKKSKNVHHQKSFRLCIHFSLKKKGLGKPAGNVNTVPKCVCNRCTFSKQELKGMSSYLHSFFETTCINIFLLSLMFCWMSLDIVWMANKSQLPPEPEGGGYTTHLEWSVFQAATVLSVSPPPPPPALVKWTNAHTTHIQLKRSTLSPWICSSTIKK